MFKIKGKTSTIVYNKLQDIFIENNSPNKDIFPQIISSACEMHCLNKITDDCFYDDDENYQAYKVFFDESKNKAGDCG